LTCLDIWEAAVDTGADRNLLFGVLALQGDLIDPDRFVEACTAWASRKDVALADLLVDRGWINAEDRAHLDYFLDRKLKKHFGDVHKSLADVADDRVIGVLAAIGDPEIHHTIDSLPKHAGHVLLSTIARTPEARERYTLTRLHARGGIGQVWLARDGTLGREVALKELRPEQTHNPMIWSRFLEEARITGQLEHPNIVPVHELVEPDSKKDQHPFYTMRFVRGRTLTEAIRAYHERRRGGRAEPLEYRALLDAFVSVCNAVAYAHSRGVIHRDLKGQNVVLGDYGEVIVLDWGLAKLVDRVEETLTPAVALEAEVDRAGTIQGQALGTPAYMSPEQAEGRIDRIDRRTDVYGLGAILYEILTDQAPFSGGDTAAVLRKVIHEPPAAPRSLDASIPKALEAVCLKALAKRPEDRYGSARDLADEIRHVLADEPVKAYREPPLLRLARWGRRHKPLVAGAAVLLVASVVGLSAGTILLGRANARVDQERRQAEANFRKAREAVDEYFTKVSESKLLNVPGLQPLRKDLLESARKYYQTFLKERGDDPSVRADAAEAWYRVGFVVQDVGSKKEAAGAFVRAAEMYEALTRAHPQVARYPYKHAMSLNDLGNALDSLGLSAAATRTQARALEIRKRVARDFPGVAEYQKELGIGYIQEGNSRSAAGNYSAAAESFTRSREIYEQLVRDHPTVADYRFRLSGSLGGLATADYHATGRLREAIRLSQEAVDLSEGLARELPDVLMYQESLAADLRSLAFYQTELGQVEHAVRAHRRAQAVYDRLANENPQIPNYRSGLAATLNSIGYLQYRVTGDLPGALTSFRHALPLVESLTRERPEIPSYRAQLAHVHSEMGLVQGRLGQPGDALQSHLTALALREEVLRTDPSSPWLQRTVAYTQYYIGLLHRAAGRGELAQASLARAQAAWEALAESRALNPYNLACAQALCAHLVGLCRDKLSPEEETRRRKYADRAIETLRQTVAGGFHNAAQIDSDGDFVAIRLRDDFQAIVAELREKSRVAQAGPEPRSPGGPGASDTR
jgi:serine/threonine-protein kinase